MSLPADVRLIDLGFDPDTRTHYMALPSCISAEDAKAFHAFVGENTFELLDEPADWLVEKGLIEVEGVTFTSQVIKIVHDLIEVRIRHYDAVVLRAAKCLHAFRVRGAARIDILRDVG